MIPPPQFSHTEPDRPKETHGRKVNKCKGVAAWSLCLSFRKLSPRTESKTPVQPSLILMRHFLSGTPRALPGHLTSMVLLRISLFIIYISESWIPNGKMLRFQPLFSLKRLFCSYINLWMQLDCFPKGECYPAPLSNAQGPDAIVLRYIRERDDCYLHSPTTSKP